MEPKEWTSGYMAFMWPRAGERCPYSALFPVVTPSPDKKKLGRSDSVASSSENVRTAINDFPEARRAVNLLPTSISFIVKICPKRFQCLGAKSAVVSWHFKPCQAKVLSHLILIACHCPILPVLTGRMLKRKRRILHLTNAGS